MLSIFSWIDQYWKQVKKNKSMEKPIRKVSLWPIVNLNPYFQWTKVQRDIKHKVKWRVENIYENCLSWTGLQCFHWSPNSMFERPQQKESGAAKSAREMPAAKPDYNLLELWFALSILFCYQHWFILAQKFTDFRILDSLIPGCVGKFTMWALTYSAIGKAPMV